MCQMLEYVPKALDIANQEKKESVTKPIQAKGRHSYIVLFENSKLRRKEEIYFT
jgi:hypothetical protein